MRNVLIVGGVALVILLVIASTTEGAELNLTPKGIRNNNPGNIRDSASNKWQGRKGADKDGYVIFDTAANGLRAMSITLANYGDRYGVNTLEGIASRWAPRSENDTAAYIAVLSQVSGYKSKQSIDLSSPSVRAKVMLGIIRNENGSLYANHYTAAQVRTASQEDNN